MAKVLLCGVVLVLEEDTEVMIVLERVVFREEDGCVCCGCCLCCCDAPDLGMKYLCRAFRGIPWWVVVVVEAAAEEGETVSVVLLLDAFVWCRGPKDARQTKH